MSWGGREGVFDRSGNFLFGKQGDTLDKTSGTSSETCLGRQNFSPGASGTPFPAEQSKWISASHMVSQQPGPPAS